MKKLVKIILALILIITPLCQVNASEEDTFRVGMEVNYAPFNLSLIHI